MELDLAVRVDELPGIVVIVGGSLRSWGPRTRTEAVLSRAGLRWESWSRSATIVVYPASAEE
jgi:hypothetical protein